MNRKTTVLKIEKAKIFEQFVDAVNQHEIDFELFEQVSYWLSQFTDGQSDEDFQYLIYVIDLMNHENPLVFAYFEKAFYDKYSFLDRVNLSSGSINECFVAKTYRAMMDKKVFEYVFKEPIGMEMNRKIGVIMR
jgi:hypothetical protein